MPWFKVDHEGNYVVNQILGKNQCENCLDPWCQMWNDKSNGIVSICDKLSADYSNLAHKELRFKAYKKISHMKYGHLPSGVCRKLGICCKIFVRKQFPNNAGELYGEFDCGKGLNGGKNGPL